jgi:hypothetical protein
MLILLTSDREHQSRGKFWVCRCRSASPELERQELNAVLI